MNTVNRMPAALATLAIVIAAYLAFMKPVRLVQMVDLNQIASVKHVDSSNVDVVDAAGKRFRMEFTEACPGLSDANTFSLDKFIGIVLNGRVCTFKDLSPINASH